MMLLKYFALVTFAGLISGGVMAQEEIVLDFTPLPQRSVITSTRTESVQVVDIRGDAKLIDGYKAQGISMPMKLTSSDFSRMRSRSGKRDEQGNLPLQLEVLEVDSLVTNAGGKAQKRRSSLSDFIGSRFNHLIRPGGTSVYVSVEGSKARPDEARMMAEAMSGTLKTMEALNGARMRVGETRQQKMGFDMPVPGMPPIRFEGLTTYRLMAIAEGLARFRFDTDFEVMPVPGGARVLASGKGEGELEFDLQKVLLRSSRSSTNLTIHIELPDRIIGNGIRMKQTFTQAVEESPVTASN